MSDVLADFEIDVTLDTYTRQSVDFVKTLVLTSSVPIRAVIQPAQKETLQALGVDLTLRHIQVHSTTEIVVGQYVVFDGTSYKIITPGNYQLYGFSDVIGAEVKGDIT